MKGKRRQSLRPRVQISTARWCLFLHAEALCGADPSSGRAAAQLACCCNTDVRNLGESVFFLSSLPSSQVYFHTACYYCRDVAPCSHFGLVCALKYFWSQPLLAQAHGLPESWRRCPLLTLLGDPWGDLHLLTRAVWFQQVHPVGRWETWAGSQPLPAPPPSWGHGWK